MVSIEDGLEYKNHSRLTNDKFLTTVITNDKRVNILVSYYVEIWNFSKIIFVSVLINELVCIIYISRHCHFRLETLMLKA